MAEEHKNHLSRAMTSRQVLMISLGGELERVYF